MDGLGGLSRREGGWVSGAGDPPRLAALAAISLGLAPSDDDRGWK
jgi:hypothetical protein